MTMMAVVAASNLRIIDLMEGGDPMRIASFFIPVLVGLSYHGSRVE